MIKNPLVSVIIAVKDESSLLRRCLNSYLNQKYSNLEIIVVDDGSGEETLAVLREFENINKIHIHHFDDCQGQSLARNYGISQASGEYIAIADADDFAYSNRISTQVGYFLNTLDLDLLGSNFTVDSGYFTWDIFAEDQLLKYQLLLNNPMVHSSVMMRRSAIRNSSLYRSEMDTAEDYDLFARMRFQWKFGNCKQKLIHYHVSAKSDKSVARQKELARRIREQVLSDYLPQINGEIVELHHAFSELKSGLSFSQIREHIAKLGKGIPPKALQKLNKILYTQFFIYCIKNGLKPNFKERLRVIQHMRCGWFSNVKNFYKWL